MIEGRASDNFVIEDYFQESLTKVEGNEPMVPIQSMTFCKSCWLAIQGDFKNVGLIHPSQSQDVSHCHDVEKDVVVRNPDEEMQRHRWILVLHFFDDFGLEVPSEI